MQALEPWSPVHRPSPWLNTAALVATQAVTVPLALRWWERRRLQARRQPFAAPAAAVGATALGALAVGALSIGALTLGALGIGRLVLGSARLGAVHIQSLTVDALQLPGR
jgi:uncharacterized iron-regulated membrane protein